MTPVGVAICPVSLHGQAASILLRLLHLLNLLWCRRLMCRVYCAGHCNESIKLLETCGEFQRAVQSCVESSVDFYSSILIALTFV